MHYIKMFIAGMALPSFVMPFVLSIAALLHKPQLTLYLFPHFIPLMWGLWNIVYFEFFQKILPGNEKTKLLLTGGLLGLLVAAYAVFGSDIPQALGLFGKLRYLPLILAPLIYAFLWLFVVNPLNRLLGAKSTWWN